MFIVKLYEPKFVLRVRDVEIDDEFYYYYFLYRKTKEKQRIYRKLQQTPPPLRICNAGRKRVNICTFRKIYIYIITIHIILT